jgi:hypothetical protein
LLRLISPRLENGVGRSPKDMLRGADLIHYRETGCDSYSKYELENLQYKIEQTEESNNKRARQYKTILYVLLISFSVLLFFSVIFTSC